MQKVISFVRERGLLPIIVILASIGLLVLTVNNDDEQVTDQPEQTEATEETAAESEDIELSRGKVKRGVISVRVASGDSQTLIARSVVQDFAKSNDLKLTPAQIVFAETHLVNSLGRRDLIYAGNQVHLNLDLVERFVERAQRLTPAERQAWNVYAQNTNL